MVNPIQNDPPTAAARGNLETSRHNTKRQRQFIYLMEAANIKEWGSSRHRVLYTDALQT